MPSQRPATGETDRISVTIPARPEFVSVARLAAATVAARQGFTYDEIEDLKTAVGEACAALIQAAPGRNHAVPVTMQLAIRPDGLEVRVSGQAPEIPLHASAATPGDVASSELDERRLGVFLMQCLVDTAESRHHRDSGTTELVLLKRHQE